MMKTQIRFLYLMLIVCVSIWVGCASRKSEPVTKEGFDTTRHDIANGEKVFMIHCQKCHPGGEAGLGPALNSNPAPGFIKKFQMRHGLGVMPSFKENEISQKDLQDISEYLKAWKAR